MVYKSLLPQVSGRPDPASVLPASRDGHVMAIEVDIQRSGRAVLVVVAGDLDIESASALSVAPDGDVDLVILDARRLSFIDCSGLDAIVALHRRLRAENATLRLVVRPESMMRHMLRITDLDTIIPIVAKPETRLVAVN